MAAAMIIAAFITGIATIVAALITVSAVKAARAPHHDDAAARADPAKPIKPRTPRTPRTPWRLDRIPRDRKFLAAFALVVAIGAGAATWFIAGASTDAPAICERTAELRISSSLETEKIAKLRELAAQYVDSRRAFAKNECANIVVDGASSGDAEQALEKGWTATAAPGWDLVDAGTGSPMPAPNVWLPTDSLWYNQLIDAFAARRIQPPELVKDSILKSPLVIAMPRDMANALMGDPSTSRGWNILDLANDPTGYWNRLHHSDWGEGGRFSFGKDNPTRSTSGLIASIVSYYVAKTDQIRQQAISGEPAVLEASDIRNDRISNRVRRVEHGVKHYGDNALAFLDTLAQQDATQHGLGYISAVLLEEQLVYHYNSGASRNQRLVPILPRDGTFMMDHPFVLAPGADDKTRAAAKDFAAYLTSAEPQKALLEQGFRSPTATFGKDMRTRLGYRSDEDARPSPTTFARPKPAVVTEILKQWGSIKKPARIVLALDTSGSMCAKPDQNSGCSGSGSACGPTPAKDSKLAAVKVGAVDALALLDAADEVALWTFPDVAAGGRYKTSAPVRLGAPRSEQRDSLTAAIEGLNPCGSTPLFATVEAAAQYLRTSPLTYTVDGKQERGINIVVVLTDGKNDDAQPYDDQGSFIQKLRDMDGDIPVYGIAFGTAAEGSVTVFDEMAQASGGGTVDATKSPFDVRKAFADILSRF